MKTIRNGRAGGMPDFGISKVSAQYLGELEFIRTSLE
jgi:hypothetical protein